MVDKAFSFLFLRRRGANRSVAVGFAHGYARVRLEGMFDPLSLRTRPAPPTAIASMLQTIQRAKCAKYLRLFLVAIGSRARGSENVDHGEERNEDADMPVKE